MNYAEAQQYLFSLGHETLALKLGLHNIERLLESLSNPQTCAPAVQIAGTNGKGSTAAFLDAICRAASINTGLYTSPHLIDITERIKLNGHAISQTDFARLTDLVRQHSQKLQQQEQIFPTFFEQITAIGLTAYREAQVELMILETGLGGRLDATTAARADTIAITPVDYDHQEYLGETLTQIAGEKAAIIRPGTQAVIAPQPPEAESVINRRLSECGVIARQINPRIEIIKIERTGRMTVNLTTVENEYRNVQLNLRGKHQLINASVAVNLAEVLRAQGFPITRDAIIHGLETAVHPGRLEYQAKTLPPLLLDGAHNLAGAKALADYLSEFAAHPLTIIFSALRDKPLADMARIILPLADSVILTVINDPRAASLEQLSDATSKLISKEKIFRTHTPAAALKLARQITPENGLIAITGSLYLLGQIQQELLS